MGELNCSGKVAKLILAVCNLVVMLAGLAMIGVAIWFVSDPNAIKILQVTSDPSSTTRVMAGAAGGIVIFSGLLLFLVGLIGFCGAMRHKTGCLNCFSAILIILIILQLVAAILAGVFHSQISSGLTTSMNTTMNQYKTSNITREAWNFVQYEFKCCGFHNSTNWKHVNWTDSKEPVPLTCCAHNSKTGDYLKPDYLNIAQCYDDARSEVKNSTMLYFRGCETMLEEWIGAQLGPLIGIAVAVVVIEIVGIILSCLLTARIKSGYEYV